jgi:tetratricopeptide (TPR) repeat protein
MDHFKEVLRLRPNSAKAHHGLAALLALERKTDDAIWHFQRAVELDSGFAEAHFNLGLVWLGRNQPAAAIPCFLRVAQLQPGNAEARYRLGLARYAQKDYGAAMADFESALALDAAHVSARNNLAWLLATAPEATRRDGRRALALIQPLDPKDGPLNAELLDTLAAAHAELGSFAQAVEVSSQALAAAEADRNETLAQAIRLRQSLYRANLPFREYP